MKTTIKTLKKHASKPDQLNEGFDDKTPIVYAHCGLFEERFAHEVLPHMRHTGWYTNADGTTYKDGSGMARGIVASFPARPGFPDGWHVAGYHWGDNDERVFYLDVYDDIEEAARDADRYAEWFADVAREDNEKWEAAREIEGKIEDLSAECRKMFALRNHAKFPDARDECLELIEKIRSLQETLKTDYAEYC